VLALELCHEVVDHPVVKVLTAQMSVAAGRLNLKISTIEIV
jgi:hypothetical protein